VNPPSNPNILSRTFTQIGPIDNSVKPAIQVSNTLFFSVHSQKILNWKNLGLFYRQRFILKERKKKNSLSHKYHTLQKPNKQHVNITKKYCFLKEKIVH